MAVPISDFLPDVRLGKYGPPDDAQTCEKYLYNIRLCESLYPALRVFEAVLRHKTDLVLTTYMGQEWIFNFVQMDDAIGMEKYIRDRKELVETLPFVFWCRLFQSGYRKILWRKYPNALQDIFEKCNNRGRLSKMPYEIDQIRRYRNMVAHNGCVFDNSAPNILPADIHAIMCRMLREMGAKSVLKELKRIDRFDDVLDDGIMLGFIEPRKNTNCTDDVAGTNDAVIANGE